VSLVAIERLERLLLKQQRLLSEKKRLTSLFEETEDKTQLEFQLENCEKDLTSLNNDFLDLCAIVNFTPQARKTPKRKESAKK
jgi:hypothetical protein